MNNRSMAAVAMVLGAAALWGTTGTAQSLAPAQTSPYGVGAVRLVVATGFFAAVVTAQRGAWAVPLRSWPWIAVAGACVAAYNLSFFAGVKAAGVAPGTLLALGSGPVWAGLMQWLLSRRPPAPLWWLGTALAVVGAAFMLSGTPNDATVLGTGLCLAAGLAYAGYTLASKRLVQSVSPSVVTLWTFSSAALVALPVAAAVGGFDAAPSWWGVVLYLGVVATGVAYLLFSHALRHLSGATAVTLALAEPVVAFLLAITVVGERPGAGGLAGLLLVLAGLLIVVWSETGVSRAQAPRTPTRGST